MTMSSTTPSTGAFPAEAEPGTAGGTDPDTLEYDAVLLAGFGGPEGPDDVMPFLRNVTRGRGIPDERLVEVSHHYLALDGISPINGSSDSRAALTLLWTCGPWKIYPGARSIGGTVRRTSWEGTKTGTD